MTSPNNPPTGGSHEPYGSGAGSPNDPYGASSGANGDSFGSPAPGGAGDPYAAPAGGVPSYQAPGTPQGGVAPGYAPVSKTKWIVQIVVAAVCFFNIITIILGILGLTKADTDLPTANKYYKWGWIAYAIWIVLVLVGYGLIVALSIASTPTSSY